MEFINGIEDMNVVYANVHALNTINELLSVHDAYKEVSWSFIEWNEEFVDFSHGFISLCSV